MTGVDTKPRTHILYEITRATYLGVDNADSVKKPIRNGEQERERGEEGSTRTHSWQAGVGRPEEQGPNGQHEDEELEGDGEEEALTGGPTRLQSVWPHNGRKKQENQRRGQNQQPHTQTHSQGKVAAEALGPVLYFLPQTDHFLLGNTQLRRACYCGGGFSPVVILKEK